jgi:hypothetical protein
MTPKEQAMELMLDYYKLIPMNTVSFSKQCALIAVKMVILNCYEEEEYYWQEVKQEIKKL